MVIKRKCNSCKQTAEFPCSCCGYELHHVDCSDRNCEKHWKGIEEFRLSEIDNLSKQPKSAKDEMEAELESLKEYKETKMDKDTTTSAEIKEWINGYIVFLEREIVAKQKTKTKTEIAEIEEKLRSRLTELEKYKPEMFYARSFNRPANTSCPHWQNHCQQVIDTERINARSVAIDAVNTHWNAHRILSDDTINGLSKDAVLTADWESNFTTLTTVAQIDTERDRLKGLIDYQAAIEHTSKLSLQALPYKKGGK